MPSSRYWCVLAAVLAATLISTPAHAQESGEHGALVWDGTSAQPCLGCHRNEALEVHGSAHYQWEGAAPYNLDGGALQGKKKTAFNSYCVNITGNFGACGNCHVGRGAFPDASAGDAQLQNIDCLVCHQAGYKRKKVSGVFVADTANMTITPTQAVQTVHRPTRATCLQCHAKGGGGDNFKRGDLALAHATTSDRSFDVHMATSGANLNCTACHTNSQHRIAGRGSDLRQTDLDAPMNCSNGSCHVGKASGGHGNADLDKHVNRVACQTCHVGPVSARNARDTSATEATEVFRDWSAPPHLVGTQYHPETTLANNIKPAYRFWNKYSNNYSFGEVAVLDATTGAYPTSRTAGAITDTATTTKLYPFKYKTARQPYAYGKNVLVALDTSVFFSGAGLPAATQQGLVNMGYSSTEPTELVTTDTYQLLTHEIAPKDSALKCEQCHGSTATQMNLRSLGYVLKASESTVCSQCHKRRANPGWKDIHSKHVQEHRYDCSTCHSFTRPELGLRIRRTRG